MFEIFSNPYADHCPVQRTTLSTKCAELDQEVPQQLGVSRAILDNVIFCHQEENNWPLGEPSSLKKKFDDIFESARYQKAVDNLKSTRKDLATDNRVAQAQLEGLKTDKQRAEGVSKLFDVLIVLIIIIHRSKKKCTHFRMSLK